MVEVATKAREVETAPEDGALEVRLGEKSQKFGNRLVACTRRCHGQAGGHAGREAGGGKTHGAGEGGREERGREGFRGRSLMRGDSLEVVFGVLLLL